MLAVILKFALVKSTDWINLILVDVFVSFMRMARHLVNEQSMAMKHLVADVAVKPSIVSFGNYSYIFQ